MTFGLIGYPLSHSFSARYFTEKFAELGLADSHRYLNFPMEDISGFCELRDMYPDLRGVNVTIPHKQAVIPLLDELDPVAARIGAVNCIRFDDEGRTIGFNTDYIGFREDLLDHLRRAAWTERAFGLPHSKDLLLTFLESSAALILGTGGASLAVREALRDLGLETTYVSRTPGPNRLTYAELTGAHLQDHLLVVNTTPLGMAPNVHTHADLPYSSFSRAHFAYDLVYNPAESEFLRRAREAGAATGNGMGMLARQAEAGWEIWK